MRQKVVSTMQKQLIYSLILSHILIENEWMNGLVLY